MVLEPKVLDVCGLSWVLMPRVSIHGRQFQNPYQVWLSDPGRVNREHVDPWGRTEERHPGDNARHHEEREVPVRLKPQVNKCQIWGGQRVEATAKARKLDRDHPSHLRN